MKEKRVLFNVVSSITLQILAIICGFIIPKTIIYNYGSNINGLVTSITKFLSYILLMELGFGTVIKSVLYKPIAYKNKEEIKQILKASGKFFKWVAYIFIVYIVVLCFTFPAIVSNDFSAKYTISLIVIMAISIFAEYFFGMTYKLYLQAEQKTYVISVIHVSTLILNVIATVILVKLGTSIHIVKIVTAMIFLARPLLQNVYVKKKYNINLRSVDGNYKISQKWDGIAQHVAYVIHTNADIVILTLFSSISEVSVYYVYSLIVSSIKNVFQGFTNGIDATFGDMIAKNEQEKLNKSFRIYEVLFFSMITILLTSTFFLIVPFVSVYTKGITDANYIRPTFAYIMVISEFIWAIREPYNTIIKVAGHFKQTQKGAWVEAIVNVVISVILVWKYGLVGVAIGTVFAMTIRAIEFVFYTSRHILKRSLKYNCKYLLFIVIEFLIIVLVKQLLPVVEINNYFEWIGQAIQVTAIATATVIIINMFAYKNEIRELNDILKRKNILSLAIRKSVDS